MNEAILPPFSVTTNAIEQVDFLGGCLLITIETGGCRGSTYAFSIHPGPDELPSSAVRFGCAGAWLFVSPEALDVLRGSTLDYGPRLRPPRFRILRNPNTPDVCPCRRSFGVPWPGPRQPTCRSYMPMPWDNDFDPPKAWRRQTGWDGQSRPATGR